MNNRDFGKLTLGQSSIFERDFAKSVSDLNQAKCLVIGASGSIGQAVTKEIFKLNPKALHVVDISENNLVELVRDLRSTQGYIDGDFRTFALDIGSDIFDSFCDAMGPYDYVLNLSALKHVRSEKDPFTLMRLIEVNIFNTIKVHRYAEKWGAQKYFCVSTDKATNPVNLMGGSKRIMEKFLFRDSERSPVSTARFANVAFSDGSLLHGFTQRVAKRQPIAAPNDVKRYFVSSEESGQLCLMSCLLGENRDIFFPKLSEDLDLIRFDEIAIQYLEEQGYEPYLCKSEEEAREKIDTLIPKKKWPCYFSASNTTGEKDFEEFFTDDQVLDMTRFENIGVIKNDVPEPDASLSEFEQQITRMRVDGNWDKAEIVALFRRVIPELEYEDKGVYLDSKM